jgi:hypothetical protein
VHANHSVAEQRVALIGKKQSADQLGIDLSAMSISQYVVLQAKRRQAGLPFLDEQTITRFVQYPERNTIGEVCVPIASISGDRRLYLGGAEVDSVCLNSGIRRVLRVNSRTPNTANH